MAEQIAKDDGNRERAYRVAGAPDRHPELFALLEEARELLCKWVDDPTVKTDRTPLSTVRLASCVRIWNMFKATAPLLERIFGKTQ